MERSWLSTEGSMTYSRKIRSKSCGNSAFLNWMTAHQKDQLLQIWEDYQ